MKDAKKIVILLFALGVMTGFTQDLRDFSGHYNAGAAGSRGVTVGRGKSGTIMTNQVGVTVVLSSTQRGVDVNAAGAGVDMQLKR